MPERARPAVFVDRDGKLVEDPGYLHRPEDVRLLPGAAPAVARLNAAGYLVVMVTDQSGIARGLYDARAYEAVQQRLAALLADSRKFQNEVSEKLAEQVLHALYELLRQVLAEHPEEVYRALLTVILRLVLLLYAEERDMLPEDETFLRHYSLAGLYERLREDAALFPDTMDQRFGAWAQLLVLFRMIHDGADAGAMRLPKRHGVLFDPDRFKFLEGRPIGGARQVHERIDPPLVPLEAALKRAP